MNELSLKKQSASGKNKILLLFLFVLGVFYLWSYAQFERWDKDLLGGGDPWGYYLYLPASFIYGDLDNLRESYRARYKYQTGYDWKAPKVLDVAEAQYIGDGKQIIKYTMGIALLEAPFFFVAHYLAPIWGYPQDGYSFPYIFFIQMSSIFYALLGFFFLYQVLTQYFSSYLSCLILAVVGLGTNLYFFTTFLGPMAHIYLFSLYCVLLYATIRWYASEKMLYALIIGICCGWITLIRPVELICILIPLLYGIGSKHSWKERIQFIVKYKWVYLLAILCFMAVGMPQFFYWKSVSGDWFFYSYGEEGFNFANPKLKQGLFGFKNGWLAYTPIMYLALLGIVFLFKKRDFWWPVVTFLPLHIYIAYSWWCWNYINGFGSRPMVETYALLAIPMGHTLQYFLNKKWLKYGLVLVLLFFGALNIFNTFQFSWGMMWSEASNFAYYRSVFGKTHLDRDNLVAYDSEFIPPDTSQYYLKELIFLEHFEDTKKAEHTSKYGKTDDLVYEMNNKEQEFFRIKLKDIDAQRGDWIRISSQCLVEQHNSNIYQSNILISAFEMNGKTYRWRYSRIDNKLDNPHNSLWGGKAKVWDEVYMWNLVSKMFDEETIFKSLVKRTSSKPIYLDDYKVELWRKKEK